MFTEETGATLLDLWEWTLTYRAPHTNTTSGASQVSQQQTAPDTTAEDAKFAVQQYRK